MTDQQPPPQRRKLPDERKAITHKFDIAGHEGYVTVGLYDDGTPGEIFLVMAKEGSTISGFADAFATSISLALQFGVPLQTLAERFSHASFEPSGVTKNPHIRVARSVVDYVFRWLALKFPLTIEMGSGGAVVNIVGDAVPENDPDAPPCSSCGAIMVRSGSIGWKCANCGNTTARPDGESSM